MLCTNALIITYIETPEIPHITSHTHLPTCLALGAAYIYILHIYGYGVYNVYPSLEEDLLLIYDILGT
jgi:hypothetical protein